MERDIQSSDPYIKKLNTLLPAEITGLYLFIRTLAQDDSNYYPYLVGAVLVIVAVFYYLAPQIIRVSRPITRLLYCVTFILWAASIDVFTISDVFELKQITFVVPAVVAVWSFALPYIFDRLGGAP